jgi:hypothetical protein
LAPTVVVGRSTIDRSSNPRRIRPNLESPPPPQRNDSHPVRTSPLGTNGSLRPLADHLSRKEKKRG